ncbi:MAG: hypothetical protein KKA73_02085 [Chloroflexi bacterium]|nr:hypothetical protein [Chloroflexota bacterium]MBU1746456.1 hypothetical protein [Chloroflexota bacterium]
MIFIANIVAVAVVGFRVLRCGRDKRVGNAKAAHWLRIAGLIPLGLQVLIYLFFGMGEMASGEPGSAMHLLEAIVIALLGTLAWMRPLGGGIALLVCGTFSAISFIVALVASGPLPEGAVTSSSVIITAVPQIISGVLFFIAGILSQRATAPQEDLDK